VLRGANPVRPIPAQLTSFVGRGSEIRQVAEALRAARLVTIIGPGGAGKTRLAIESARRAPEVCFVELAELQDAAQVPQAVIGALGLRDAGLFSAGEASDPVPG
jgi:predicted ATPase